MDVSQYARQSALEDFAETWELYWSSKGRPDSAELRRLLSHRFAIMDELVAGGSPGAAK